MSKQETRTGRNCSIRFASVQAREALDTHDNQDILTRNVASTDPARLRIPLPELNCRRRQAAQRLHSVPAPMPEGKGFSAGPGNSRSFVC
jgi:hypothetical protein